jgi:hypothetical protein
LQTYGLQGFALCFSSRCLYIATAKLTLAIDVGKYREIREDYRVPRFLDNWRTAWRSHDFRRQFFISLAALCVGLILHRFFQEFIEHRPGVSIPDPLLSLFRPVDLHWIAYSIIYSGVLLALTNFFFHPYTLLLFIRSFVIILLMQVITLYLLPLDPPHDMIVLVDPFIPTSVFHPTITHELFFSWHTALFTLFALTVRWHDLKIIFVGAAAVVSTILLLHHAHYMIDVVAAPCFAYAAYSLAGWKTVLEVQHPPFRS